LWIAEWHVRDETYQAALACLVDAIHAHPFSRIWGDGDTSSSDGQFFRAGGHGEARADYNAKYGSEPGVKFYTHVSDRYAPFYSKVIAANASEAAHVLDGLMHHESAIDIREHYTDTAGAIDHVFGLCHLLGFRFAPRIRDLADRRLYIAGARGAYKALDPVIGGGLDLRVVGENWDEILRLAASIKAGTVAPSAILRRLSSTERARQNATRNRPSGAHSVDARLDQRPRPAPANQRRAQQGRGSQCARARRVLSSSRRNPRPDLREPALPRLWPQSRRRRNHPLEHRLSRPRRR
jgi:TnpA family transposase